MKGVTEVEATPSQPPGALVEVQSPIVAACEPLVPEETSLLCEFVFGEASSCLTSTFPAPVTGGFLFVEGVVELEDPVGESPGFWHCQDESAAHEPSTCSRHCAYAMLCISRIL